MGESPYPCHVIGLDPAAARSTFPLLGWKPAVVLVTLSPPPVPPLHVCVWTPTVPSQSKTRTCVGTIGFGLEGQGETIIIDSEGGLYQTIIGVLIGRWEGIMWQIPDQWLPNDKVWWSQGIARLQWWSFVSWYGNIRYGTIETAVFRWNDRILWRNDQTGIAWHYETQ